MRDGITKLVFNKVKVDDSYMESILDRLYQFLDMIRTELN